MKNYEVLFILPGTLGEDEAAPVAAKVKEVAEIAGATNVAVKNLGKSRIAYPIKHIRYGYFHLGQLLIDPKNVENFRGQLALMPELLRVVVRGATAGGEVFEKISAISDVTVRETDGVRAGYDKKDRVRREEHIEVSHQIDSAAQSRRKAEARPKVKTETKAENIKLEDIDKKLDELLDSNMADV